MKPSSGISVLLLASLLLLTGCVTPTPYVPVTQSELESMSFYQLCRGQKRIERVVTEFLGEESYDLLPRKEADWTLITDELKTRVTAKEFRHIASERPYIGMSERALECAMIGSYPDINITRTKYGTSKQYVYGSVLSYEGATYVYTENGIVTTIQN